MKVISGEADVYLRANTPPQTNSYSYASTRVGSDGLVLEQGVHWAVAQDWYITVHATPGAQWTLLTGEAYVQQLPTLAADASSGTNATIGPEGMRFFKTTISAGTLAWRLNLSGLTNTILVHNSKAPYPYSCAGCGYYDWSGPGQMLLVPNYLNIGSQYIVGVIGNPGLNFTLDSRQQPVIDLAFNTVTNVTTTSYGYVTYRVQVPVQQIAWQVNTTPTSGDPNVAVRLNNVPNEYVNDAFSCAHRAHASTEGLAHVLPAFAGAQMMAEITALRTALEKPERPVMAIVGGSKVSTKIPVLSNLAKKVQHLVIGGGMANTFLLADGVKIGKSLAEPDFLATVAEIKAAAKSAGCTIHLPSDAVLAKKLEAGVGSRVAGLDGIAAPIGAAVDGGGLASDFLEGLGDEPVVTGEVRPGVNDVDTRGEDDG